MSAAPKPRAFIGYIIQQALRNELKARGMDKYVVTVITRVIVDKDDPAFKNRRSRSVRSIRKKLRSSRRSSRTLYSRRMPAGGVVPSPDPKIIAERYAIKALVDAGFVVIASGVEAFRSSRRMERQGIEAVIDKDLAGQRLATLIGASKFIILTDVPSAYIMVRHNNGY